VAEQLIRNQQVAGSNPIAGSSKFKRLARNWLAFLLSGRIFAKILPKIESPALPLSP
jgi:hypothetical protein